MCCVLDIIIVGNGKMGFSLADQLASEDHSMDHLPVTDRVQSIGVPGSRRTAPDIHAGDPALGT